jgi:phosphate transport system permease protein
MYMERLTGAQGPRRRMSAIAWDRYNYYLFVFSAAMVTVVIVAIILFIGLQGFATFRDVSPLEFFFTAKWSPPGSFGAFPFIFGTLAVTAIALVLGVPVGIAGAVFLAKVAPKGVREVMRPATDLFVGIPSVVYGWVGLTIVVPFVRDRLGGGSGYGLLTAGAILAVMILPTVIAISEDALRSLPPALEEGSLALGATRWQTIWKVLVPAARSPLLTAVVLAMARAIGETTAVQMVIGNAPVLPRNLLTPTSTLTAEILTEMGNTPFGTAWANSLFLMAFLLLAISLLLILMIRAIGRRAEA